MRDSIGWGPGIWHIEYLGQRIEVHNVITDAGLQWFQDLWRGLEDPGFKFIALGTSDMTAEYTQTKLGNEQVRKPIAEFLQPELGTTQSIATFLDTEANFAIRELGLIAGAAATIDINTGILIARAVVNIDKTALGSLKLVREDRLSRS